MVTGTTRSALQWRSPEVVTLVYGQLLSALSAAVPGTMHDKNLSAHLQTRERVPDGCEAEADKGSQGLVEQVSQVTLTDPQTGADQQVPRLTVKTPGKQPKGKELTPEPHAFNTHLSQVRVRLEQCIVYGVAQALGDSCDALSLRPYDLPGAPVHGLRSGQRPNPTLAGRKGGLLCIDSNTSMLRSFRSRRESLHE